MDGIFQGVTSDELLRKKLEAEADRRGNAVLYDRLKKVDPDSAAKIHLHDRRRIIRALEVYMKEKKPLSTLKKERSGLWGKFDIRIFVLNRDRAELYDLINRRVDAMLKEGLVEEIRSLMKRKWSPAADKVIGVRQIKGFLRGEYDLNRACYLMKLDTRHFAKRQLTWFRKDKRLEWIDVRPQDTSSKVVARILEKIKDE